MTRTSVELLLLAALLAAAWLAFGLGPRAPAAAGAAAKDRGAGQAGPVGEGLGERVRHLRAYLSAPPPRGAVRRNLFSFQAPRRSAAPAGVEIGAEPGADPIEARPELTLAGIAEDTGAGGTVRTAVIVSAGQLMFAKEGDRVLSRFVVLRIAADAVQIKDTGRGGEVFTLAFK